MQSVAQPVDLLDKPDAKELIVSQGNIVFNNVCFNYGRTNVTGQQVVNTAPAGNTIVIDDFSLEIAAGEKIGLVGPSGAGKSTLVNLLLRLYDVDSGTIEIDGQSTAEVTQASLRASIGMVTQDTALLHRSIRENIAFAKPDATEEQILTAAARAHALDFLQELQDGKGRTGLDAYVGERGVKLSGGQRQRVALARAVVREPNVFLMDEPLSNLDAKLRVSTRAQIKNLSHELKTTTIYVTHDQIEAMTLATKIVVMKGGVIQQIGSPAEIYNTPANLFVADFMGSPAMNLIPATTRANGKGTHIEIAREGADPIVLTDTKNRDLPENVIMGVRPEDIADPAGRGGSDAQSADCVIDIVEPAGADTFVVMQLGGKHVTARLHAETTAKAGKPQTLAFDLGKVSYFEPETGLRLN